MSLPTFYDILAVAAWALATFAPMITAIGCWELAGRIRPGWPFHLLFAPSALLIEWASVWLLFFATGDDGDGPPGLGLALLPAFFVLFFSLVIYFVALGAMQIKRFRQRV